MKLQALFETKPHKLPGKKLVVAGWQVADAVNARLKVSWEDAGVDTKSREPSKPYWPVWRSVFKEQERIDYPDGTRRYSATAMLSSVDEIELGKVNLEREAIEKELLDYLTKNNEVKPGEPIHINPKHPEDPRLAFKIGEYYYLPVGHTVEIYTKKKFWKLIGKEKHYES